MPMKKVYFNHSRLEGASDPESPEVLQNPRYRKHREFIIGSKGKALFDWHIKIGNETRIHFYIDREAKKIYIGHCGKHLPVPSYKS
jgi:hypothetical protein